MTRRYWSGVEQGLSTAKAVIAQHRDPIPTINDLMEQIARHLSGDGHRVMEWGDLDSGGRYMFPEDIGLPPTYPETE